MTTQTTHGADSAATQESARTAPPRFRQDKFRSTLHLACFQPEDDKTDKK